MTKKQPKTYNAALAESAIMNGRLLIRGSVEWEQREYFRFAAGNKVISPGHSPITGARLEPEWYYE